MGGPHRSDTDTKPVNFPAREGLNSLFRALGLALDNPLEYHFCLSATENHAAVRDDPDTRKEAV